MKKQYHIFFFIISILFSFKVFSQISDKDFSELRKAVSDESRKSPSAGIFKIDEILAVYQDKLAKYQHIRLLYLKSWFLISSDQIEKALETLEQTRLMAEEITEPGILYSYYGITASAFNYVELYELALESYIKAYKEAPLLNKPQFIQQTENNIGHVYLKLGLIKEAEHYFKRFYDSAIEMGLHSQQGVGLNNLGEAAYLKGDLDTAERLHLDALAIRQKHGFEYHKSWSFFNLGRVYAAKNHVDKAKDFLTRSINYFNKQNAQSNALLPQVELVKLMINIGEFPEADTLLKEITMIAKEYKKLSVLKEALTQKAALLRKQSNFDDALTALDERNAVIEQINERKSTIGLAYMVSQTELQTKEMALQELEQAHELAVSIAESERKIGIIILLSFMLITAITSFFLYRLNKKKLQLQFLLTQLNNTQEKLIESEKMRAMTTLVSGMAHQLNTPLGLVITANSSLQNQVQTLTQKLSNKSLTQSQLSHFLKESNELITLSQRNSEKAADMIQTFKMMSSKLQISERNQFEVKHFLEKHIPEIIRTHKIDIQYKVTGSSFEIESYSAVLLKVINQFIENSVSHGFEGVDSPSILINIASKNGKLEIHYSDNGVGIEQEKRNKIFDPFYTTRLSDGNLGLGLNIIYNSVVHIMEGKVECLGSETGAHFVIKLPKKTAAKA